MDTTFYSKFVLAKALDFAKVIEIILYKYLAKYNINNITKTFR